MQNLLQMANKYNYLRDGAYKGPSREALGLRFHYFRRFAR